MKVQSWKGWKTFKRSGPFWTLNCLYTSFLVVRFQQTRTRLETVTGFDFSNPLSLLPLWYVFNKYACVLLQSQPFLLPLQSTFCIQNILSVWCLTVAQGYWNRMNGHCDDTINQDRIRRCSGTIYFILYLIISNTWISPNNSIAQQFCQGKMDSLISEMLLYIYECKSQLNGHLRRSLCLNCALVINFIIVFLNSYETILHSFFRYTLT